MLTYLMVSNDDWLAHTHKRHPDIIYVRENVNATAVRNGKFLLIMTTTWETSTT